MSETPNGTGAENESRGSACKGGLARQLAEAGITLGHIAKIEAITGVDILHVTREAPTVAVPTSVSADETMTYALAC